MKITAFETKKLFEVMEEENVSVSEAIKLIRGNKNDGVSNLKITVDYSLTLQEMFESINYQHKQENIKENRFPIPPEVKGRSLTVSSKLFSFGRMLNRNIFISKMEEEGYRPATVHEAIFFAKTYPDLHEKFSIAALGSTWLDSGGCFRIPVVDKNKGISQKYLNDEWKASCRFLGVRLSDEKTKL